MHDWAMKDPTAALVVGCYVDKLRNLGVITYPRVISDGGHKYFLDHQAVAEAVSVERMEAMLQGMLCRTISQSKAKRLLPLLSAMVQTIQKGEQRNLPDKCVWIFDDWQKGQTKDPVQKEMTVLGYFIDSVIADGHLVGLPYVLEEEGRIVARKYVYKDKYKLKLGSLPVLIDGVFRTAWSEYDDVSVKIRIGLVHTLTQRITCSPAYI